MKDRSYVQEQKKYSIWRMLKKSLSCDYFETATVLDLNDWMEYITKILIGWNTQQRILIHPCDWMEYITKDQVIHPCDIT